MKPLFISHNPHPAHIELMKSINAKIKITKLKKYSNITKKYPFMEYLFPIISAIHSLKLNPKEKIIICEGGTSLYLSFFLKLKNPKLKLIYLDVDLFFYNKRKNKPIKLLKKIIANKIDAIISVSEESKKYSDRIIKKPTKICRIPVKNIQDKHQKRKDYALYIGRLASEKKIDRIIKFVMQNKRIKKLYIIGEGPLKNKIKQKSNKKIILINQTNNVEKYYNLCKYFIHLPDFDPHPSTTMEAVLGGCIPIISNGCGTNYLFNKTFLVNPKNLYEINSKFNYILNNPKKIQRLLNQTKKTILNKKPLNEFKTKFSEIINEIK